MSKQATPRYSGERSFSDGDVSSVAKEVAHDVHQHKNNDRTSIGGSTNSSGRTSSRFSEQSSPRLSERSSRVSERTARLSNVVLDAANKPRADLIRRAVAQSSRAQLHLSNMKLHGREADLKLLRDKLNHINDDNNSGSNRELIMVAGTSGIGKTSLISRGLQDPATKKGIAFTSGKFDQNRVSLPYSAFADAFGNLAKFIMNHKKENVVSQIKSDIQNTLGSEDLQILSSVFPGWDDMFSIEEQPRRNSSDLGSGKEAVSRLQYAVRRLLKVICTNLQSGVILFIDDLQWSDASSLDLLLCLLQDEDIPSLLLVGAYRDDEVSDSHPLSLHIREAERLGCTISIRLGNLKQETVQELVAEALDMQDTLEDVESLALTVHKKTEGNPFFVIFFLRSLYDDGLLEYNFVIERWRWDDELVKQKLVTQNVASIMVNKLKRFKNSAQNVIKIASCLGSSFSTATLGIVVDRTKKDFPDDDTELGSLIGEFENEGLLEHESDNVCRFSHDQIQFAAFELIPPENRDSFKGDIGRILINTLDPPTLEESLFDIVSLRNYAQDSLIGQERIKLGEMNVRCGIKASSNAAFDTAVIYFEAARELLNPNAFEVNFDLACQLYAAEALAHFVVGELKVSDMLLDELLSKSNIPMKVQFKAYEIKILSAQAANRFDEAISLGLDFRSQLGFKRIPTKVSIVRVIAEYIQTNRAVKGMSAEELASLPAVTDERVVMGQKVLELLMVSAYQANQSMYPLISFAQLRDTITFGVNRSSCTAYIAFGIILTTVFGDLKKGKEFGRAAELVLDRPNMKEVKSRTRYPLEGMIYHWTSPLQNTLQPLLDGYISGLETGDTESAIWCICLRSCFSWFASRPLSDLENEITPIIGVIDQLNAIGAKLCTVPFLQAAQNLLGTSTTPWILAGATMNIDDSLMFASETGNEMVRAYTTIVQLDLFVFFQKWREAKKLLDKAGNLRPLILGLYHTVRFTFLEALICLKVAQASSSWRKKGKLKARAKTTIKMIKKWLKKGNVNVVQQLHLLTAEYSLLMGRTKKAEDCFKSAQTIASRNGFLQDKALSYELAGLHYMDRDNVYWAKYNLELAYRSYSDWGAKAKCDHLRSMYPDLVFGDEKESR